MGSNKTLNIINTFVGQVVVCDITVAEPDGSNPETAPQPMARPLSVVSRTVAKGVIHRAQT